MEANKRPGGEEFKGYVSKVSRGNTLGETRLSDGANIACMAGGCIDST